MITNFKIDQAATFAGLVYLSCVPKTAFRSDRQETNKSDGTPRWTVEVLGAFRNPFGGTTNEVVKLTVEASTDPCQGLPPFTPVELVDFQVGVMEKVKKDEQGNEKVIGVSVYYRATKVRSIAETPVASGSKSAA